MSVGRTDERWQFLTTGAVLIHSARFGDPSENQFGELQGVECLDDLPTCECESPIDANHRARVEHAVDLMSRRIREANLAE